MYSAIYSNFTKSMRRTIKKLERKFETLSVNEQLNFNFK
jgi:hypothetical protein